MNGTRTSALIRFFYFFLSVFNDEDNGAKQTTPHGNERPIKSSHSLPFLISLQILHKEFISMGFGGGLPFLCLFNHFFRRLARHFLVMAEFFRVDATTTGQ